MDFNTTLNRLENVQKTGTGWKACCPAHEDKTPSLSISKGSDGRTLFHCHAGCSTPAIAQAIGLKLSDLMPDDSWRLSSSPRSNGHGTPKSNGRTYPTAQEAVASLESRLGKSSTQWTYTDCEGEAVAMVVRWETSKGKEIRPITRFNDGWQIKAKPESRPLYNLPDIIDAKRIYIVEGEKSAEAAIALGLIATCSQGGSKAAGKSDWSPLSGKDIVIVPDNDEAGGRYASDVARLAMAVGATSVKVLRLPNLPEKGDIADWSGTRGEFLNLVKNAEVWKPEPPPAPSVEKFQPFPVDALPEPIQSFVSEAAAAIGCDPSFVVLPTLAVLASAIGSVRRLQLKRGWNVPPILWTGIVGESGTQKSPPWRLAMKPLLARQGDLLARHAEAEREYKTAMVEYDKRLKVWKSRTNDFAGPPIAPEEPVAKRHLVSDVTVESLAPILKSNDRGVLMSRDELNAWLGSFDQYKGGKSGADEAHWLSAYNGEPIVVDRKSGIPKTVFVPHAYISVTGGIQPNVLKRSLGREHCESGLAARFLFTNPPRKTKRWSEAEIDEETEAEYAAVVDDLLGLTGSTDPEGDAEPVLLQLTAEAKDSYVEFYSRHAEELASMSGDLAAAWSKLEEIPARLAIIIHEVNAVPEHGNHVTGETMAAAIEITEWFKHESRRLYGAWSESDEDRERRELLEWIESQGGEVTIRQTMRAFRARFPDSESAEVSLRGLAGEGYGVVEILGGEGRGRRPLGFRLQDTGTLDTNS